MALTIVDKTNPGLPCWFRGQPKGQAGAKTPVFKVVQITFDSSYPTGGEAISADDVGLASILNVFAHPAAGYVFEWDATNGKLMARWVDTTTDGAAMTQVTNATNLATVVTRAIVFGYEKTT